MADVRVVWAGFCKPRHWFTTAKADSRVHHLEKTVKTRSVRLQALWVKTRPALTPYRFQGAVPRAALFPAAVALA